jgi:hypothetical protein
MHDLKFLNQLMPNTLGNGSWSSFCLVREFELHKYTHNYKVI